MITVLPSYYVSPSYSICGNVENEHSLLFSISSWIANHWFRGHRTLLSANVDRSESDLPSKREVVKRHLGLTPTPYCFQLLTPAYQSLHLRPYCPNSEILLVHASISCLGIDFQRRKSPNSLWIPVSVLLHTCSTLPTSVHQPQPILSIPTEIFS